MAQPIRKVSEVFLKYAPNFYAFYVKYLCKVFRIFHILREECFMAVRSPELITQPFGSFKAREMQCRSIRCRSQQLVSNQQKRGHWLTQLGVYLILA